MKEYDRVKLTVEKDEYAQDGAHKGMVGWICDERVIDDCRLVCFDECDLDTFPILSIKECDLEVVWELPIMKVGSKVILFTSAYEKDGLKKGVKGVIVANSAKENEWLVRFPKQDGLDKETKFVVEKDSVADLAVVGDPNEQFDLD